MSICKNPSLLSLALLVAAAFPACGLDPGQPAANYLRVNFTVENGLPSNVVNAITQTRNGFLWIGSDVGLARFNGRVFSPVSFRGAATAPQGGVNSVAEAPNGDLWIGTRSGLVRILCADLDRFERPSSTVYHLGTGLADEIRSLHFSHNGTLWVGTEAGLFRFLNGHFLPGEPRSPIERIEEGSNGHLLVVSSEGFKEIDGSKVDAHLDLAKSLGVGANGFFHVFQDHGGTLWYGTGAGLARSIQGTLYRFSPYGLAGAPGAIRIYEDPQANIWVLFTNGVFRATGKGLEPLDLRGQAKAVFGDRDGNLWIGTNGAGLARVSDRHVRVFKKEDGLPNDVTMAVLSARDGSLWVGNNCGGVSKFDGKRFKTYNEKNGLSNSCVWALAEDREDHLWIGTWGGGLFRFADGKFTQFSKREGLASEVVRKIIVASDGSLWIATEGGLSHMRAGRIRNYTVQDGLSSDRVLAVYQDRNDGIWVGTNRGVDHMVADHFNSVRSAREIFDPILVGFGEDLAGNLYSLATPKGIDRIQSDRLIDVDRELGVLGMLAVGPELWFSGDNGIYRIAAAALLKSSTESDAPLDYTVFGPADGLASTQCSIGAPNMSLGRDAKLWIATVQGLASFDIHHMPVESNQPKVFVDEVKLGRTERAAGRELVLPPGTHHLDIHFDSISLTSPEKVRFQYRMDGVDQTWLDADETRQATYTSIPIGEHAFHVRACNVSGVWDLAGIAYPVTQRAYFYETLWFQLIATAALALLIFFAYRFRLRQIADQMSVRLDERLAERMRLARELHDTLLQTIQATKMISEVALESPDPTSARRTLPKLSAMLTQAIDEGRAVLTSLRTSISNKNDLAEAFRLAGENHSTETSIPFEIFTEGPARDLHPIVRDEVCQIVIEAIRNAFLHSQARVVQVRLIYAHDLTIRVRDNGKGIGTDILSKGKPGRFGIMGMRERAERVGAKLHIHSLDPGTDVELIVPATVGFHEKTPAQLRKSKSAGASRDEAGSV